MTDETQRLDCMATSPTPLRRSPRNLTRTCLTLKPTATTRKDDVHTVSLISHEHPEARPREHAHRPEQREKTAATPLEHQTRMALLHAFLSQLQTTMKELEGVSNTIAPPIQISS